LVYITDVTGGTAAGQRANIIDTGYYYFDGTIWMKIGSGGTGAVEYPKHHNPGNS
jgi:hypothetical protein